MYALKYLWIIFLLLSPNVFAASIKWKELAPGLKYTELHPYPNYRNKKLHAFQIDLSNYKLSSQLASHHHQKTIFINRSTIKPNALITINGGFFMPNFKLLGLRINNGKILSPLKNISWWGVFVTQNNRAQIVSQQKYHYSSDISFAIQAGPRLIINGNIPKLKDGIAQRSALGITKNGKVIIAITENLSLTTRELAKIMKKSQAQGGLACNNALNLDGGSSSQLYAHIGSFYLNIPSLRPVADMIVVSKKT